MPPSSSVSSEPGPPTSDATSADKSGASLRPAFTVIVDSTTTRTTTRSSAAATWRAKVVLPNPPGASMKLTGWGVASARSRSRPIGALP